MGKKKSQTEQLMMAVAKAEEKAEENAEPCDCPDFPPLFLVGMRAALDSGLSCEQLVAFLVLFTGVYETSSSMAGLELVERAQHLAGVMRGDINYVCMEKLRLKRNKEARALKKKHRKMR